MVGCSKQWSCTCFIWLGLEAKSDESRKIRSTSQCLQVEMFLIVPLTLDDCAADLGSNHLKLFLFLLLVIAE